MAKAQETSFKLVIVGNEGVGKTSISSYIRLNAFLEDYNPTRVAQFYECSINVDGNNIELPIWDMSGKEIYQPILPMYARCAAGAAIIFDVTNEKSFNDLQKWIDALNKIEKNLIIVIVGNKIDLIEERKISKEQAETFSIDKNIHYFETSAKNKEGIDDFLTYLVTEIFYSKNFHNKNS